MLRQGRPAHVVNTASMAGLVASAELAPYCASKFGVVGLSEALNAELAPKGIHVTALCPGIIDTDIVRTATYRGEMAARADRVREFYRSRGAPPEVVAEAALRAIRKRRLIQPAPYSHVLPPWILKRVSPRASQVVSRAIPRLVRR
jgi:short-subunit dehydrogenase